MIFTSGHLGKTLTHLDRQVRKPDQHLFAPGTHFLRKPFAQSELLEVVARALGHVADRP